MGYTNEVCISFYEIKWFVVIILTKSLLVYLVVELCVKQMCVFVKPVPLLCFRVCVLCVLCACIE